MTDFVMNDMFQIEYRRHYILLAAFALSFLIVALVFLFVHTVILKDTP